MHVLRDRRQIRFTRGAHDIVPVLAELRRLDDLRRRIGDVLDPLAQQPALILVSDLGFLTEHPRFAEQPIPREVHDRNAL
jgi:hypothetical protein